MGTAAISGLLAGYGIAMPIGAVAVFLINLGATACLCIGAAAGLGAATVDGGLALAAVVGGTGFARQVQAAAGPLHWAAGLVLAVVAVWMARAAIRRYRLPAATPRAALRLHTPLRAYTARRRHLAQSAYRRVLGSRGAGPPDIGNGLYHRAGRRLRVGCCCRVGELAGHPRQRRRADRPSGRQPAGHAGRLTGIQRADRRTRRRDPQPITQAGESARPLG